MTVVSRRGRIMALLAEHQTRATLAARICGVCVQLAGVDGAAMTVMAEGGQRGLVHATDAIARRLDDVQLTLGEGPCVDAFAIRHPVLVPNLGLAGQPWPAFIGLASAPVAALFSFPLQVGAARLGTLDLYRETAGPLDSEQLADTLVCADLATQTLLASTAGPVELVSLDDVDTHTTVYQATGMVMVQLGVSATDALMRLRGHAYANDQLVTEVAHEVVQRRLLLPGDQT